MAIDPQTGARLAAYLDGELDGEARRQVEALMAERPEVRRALEELRETRRMLDRYRSGDEEDTTASVTPRPDLSGHRVDHFIVESLVARGGMGEVYRALDTSLDRTVALKLIAPQLGADPAIADRFVREARVQAGLDHPHVAQVHHIGRHEGRLYFAMEYLPGGSLEDRLRREAVVEPEQAVEIAVEAADILEATRRRGIVHRDLKPSNIMFTADGKVKLTDFGLAKPTADDQTSLTRSGATVGTPHYLSPEAAAGGEVTWQSDMYALGCTLYRMLFGRTPYAGSGAVQVALAHVREPFPTPERMPEGVGQELLDVVRRMMAKDPAERFPDYESLIAALNAARPRLVRPIHPLKRLGVGALDLLLAGTVFVVAGAMVEGLARRAGAAGPAVQALWVPVLAIVAVSYMGIIPALSGSTLVQGLFNMKARCTAAARRPRLRLFFRGLIAHPFCSLALVVLVGVILLRGQFGRALALLSALLALPAWHLIDFGVSFFDRRRRMLHDILFRTRLQYVSYEQ